MFKRALMLTAATAALLCGPAFADTLDIDTEINTPLKTSTALNGNPADILIEDTGSVVVTTAGPAIEIDSPNVVTNNGTISNKDTDLAVGVQLDATPDGNGPGTGVIALDNFGTIDLSGDGTGKAGILVTTTGDAAGTFNGDIVLEAESELIVEGGFNATESTGTQGLHVAENTTFNGKIDILGAIQMTDDAAQKTGILIGTPSAESATVMNGDILFEAGSTLTMVGDGSTGLQIAENATVNGNIDLEGAFDLTGDGASKTGIQLGTLNADTGATLNGDLTIGSAATLQVKGDGSHGIFVAQNSVINGNLDIEGALGVAPGETDSTSAFENAILVENNPNGASITGDVTIGETGIVSATGFGSKGISLLGDVGGSFTNSGTISAIGISSPDQGGDNPEASSALVLGGSIGGGFLNAGPISSSDDTPTARIQMSGNAPGILIQPDETDAPAHDIHFGIYDDTQGGLIEMSFINRGDITAAPIDPNFSLPGAISIIGVSDAERVIFDGGFYNSGSISATAASNDDGEDTGYFANALWIQHDAVVPSLTNSNQGGNGAISATVTGPKGGSAAAVFIDEGGFLGSIVNSGTISGVAGTSDTTITNLSAYAILDKSGTVNFIDNSGLILAFATELDDGSQIAHAVDLSASTQNITFNNTGTVTGDVLFGSGADSLTLNGTTDNPATVTGDIQFGGTAGAGNDRLEIGDFSTVTGAISDRAGGRLDVQVHGGGTLNLTNDSIDPDERFIANTFRIDAGGTLGLTLSQTYNIAVNSSAGGIVTTTGQTTLDPLARLDIGFGSFITGTAPGQTSQFILFDAPINQLSLNLQALDDEVCPLIPFLFKSDNNECLARVNDATSNRSQLVLSLIPKTAEDLELRGYALKMFPFANEALATDDELGAAVIEAGLPVNGVPLTPAEGNALYQDIYSQFAPNVTGASRALGIALTDQATGPVGARQRALRMYAAQPGDATLWGQEFALSLNQDANANTVGYRDSGFGFALGLDGGNPSDGRYGGAFTFYSGDISEKQPRVSKTSTLWALLSGYTDWRGRGFFLDSQATVGIGQLDGRRGLRLEIPQEDGTTATLSRSAEGKRDTLLGAVGITTGAIFTTGSTVFTPLLSIDGMAMRENGYKETGGGTGFDLDVKPTYYQSLRAFLGADLRQDINLGDFYLQPAARAGYRYDFLNDPEKLKAAFTSTETPFTIIGPDPSRGNAIFGGSLAATTGAWSVGLSYDYLRGDDGSVSQEGTLTLVGRI